MRQKATNVLLWNVREVSYMTQNLGEWGGGGGGGAGHYCYSLV